MTDSHQAIYDAVRSKISGGNIADAVQTAIREANIGHFFMLAAESMKAAAWQWERPSVLFRPDVAIDGNKYSVLYGPNLAEGCAGFGDSLAEAMADFDKNWSGHKLSETGLQTGRKCERCDGTGAIDAPYSGSDPSCPECDGEGIVSDKSA
ncbi:hypothetical protein LCGC14_3078440 [marine sediment metagenome]|uniref:Uncharacterized protein n=1 Tax=marine sediment metagenome TaxID=412755 RepID=A0A0F8X2J0_9ZZZZ